MRAGEWFHQRFSEREALSWNISCGRQKKAVVLASTVLPLNESMGKLTYWINCDKQSRGGPERYPCPITLFWVFFKSLAPVVCIDMNLFPPDKNEEFSAAWKDPPAVHGWHGLLCCCHCRCCRLAFDGGSLSAIMKWKSSRAVNACTQKVIGDCHWRTPHDMLSIQLHRRADHKVWLCLLLTKRLLQYREMGSCSDRERGRKGRRKQLWLNTHICFSTHFFSTWFCFDWISSFQCWQKPEGCADTSQTDRQTGS